jgi:hypothetical protein
MHLSVPLEKVTFISLSSDQIDICNRFVVGRDMKFPGPFYYLNHKVDLTRYEAENTLLQRQEQYEQ